MDLDSVSTANKGNKDEDTDGIIFRTRAEPQLHLRISTMCVPV